MQTIRSGAHSAVTATRPGRRCGQGLIVPASMAVAAPCKGWNHAYDLVSALGVPGVPPLPVDLRACSHVRGAELAGTPGTARSGARSPPLLDEEASQSLLPGAVQYLQMTVVVPAEADVVEDCHRTAGDGHVRLSLGPGEVGAVSGLARRHAGGLGRRVLEQSGFEDVGRPGPVTVGLQPGSELLVHV